MEKILVPIDGSPASENAAEKAIELAKKYNSEVIFLSVVDTRFTYTYDIGGIISIPMNKPNYTEELMSLQSKILDFYSTKFSSTGILIRKVVLSGEPHEEIISYANKKKVDLIVMGRRGFSKVKRFFVGSITQRVLADSPCPVLVVSEKNKLI